MRSAERINAKRHSELAGLKTDGFRGPKASVDIENLDFAAVAEIGLNEIVGKRSYLSVDGDSRVSHLKTIVATVGGGFKASADGSVDVGSICESRVGRFAERIE